MAKIPDSYDIDLDIVGPVELSGIPSSLSLDLTHIAKIQIGLDPITVNPVTINPITVNPLDLSVRIKEIPSIRGHIPADFTVGLSVLGFQFLCLRLCGEAQVITEPYKPNPCEICGGDVNISTGTLQPSSTGATITAARLDVPS